MTDPSGFPDPSRLGPKRPPAPYSPGPGRPESPRAFPAATMGLLSLTLLVAWFVQGPVGPPGPAAGPPATAPDPDRPPASPSGPPPATAEGLDRVRGEVAALAARVGALGSRLDAIPAEPPRFDPSPLRAEIREARAGLDELARKVAQAPPAPAAAAANFDARPLQARLDELARVPAQVADLQKRLQGLQDRVGANADELAAMKTEGELRSASVLFQQRKYGPALESFRKLQQSYPTDARVWYYSALCSGLSTGKWDGDALAWVNEGVAREQAGTPEPARITAEFSGLVQGTGREWLDYHRKQARP